MASGRAPLPSPDGSRFVHVEVHDGLQDLLVGELGRRRQRPNAAADGRRRRRGPSSAASTGNRINPWDGVWRAVGWLADGAWVAAIGERETAPQDLWLLPVPGVAPDDARPRQVTDSLPAVLRAALSPSRVPTAERITVKARDGLRVEGTLWRPLTATGKRGGKRVPTIIYPHGGPTGQSFRSFQPFKQLLVAEGFAMLDVDFRGSTGYGRAFRLANHGEWGHADVDDLIDAARWATSQPWSDGRLADLRRLVRRLPGPVRARRGAGACGRPGSTCTATRRSPRATATATGSDRLDLHKMMGSPDDPERSRGLPPRLAGLPRRADRGAAAASSTAARTSASSRS